MDFLAPSYLFLVSLRQSLESGVVLNEAVQRHLKSHENAELNPYRRWWVQLQLGLAVDPQKFFSDKLNQSLAQLIARGIQGQPILQQLHELEDEMQQEMFDTLEQHLQKLPVLTLLPLLFFVFPGFMLLLLGPIFTELMGSLK